MLLMLFFCIVATFFVGWRYSLFFFILVGFLQDPVRKAMVGQSVVYTTFAIVVFGCAFLIAFFKQDILREGGILDKCPDLLLPIQLYVIIVILQAAHGYMSTQNVIVTVLGSATYVTPIIGVIMGYYYVRSYNDIIIFIKMYVVIAACFVSTVWLEWLGYNWPVFGTVGMKGDWLVHSGYGHYAPMLSGLMRSGEVASWHGITAAILGILIVVTEKKWSHKFLFGSMALACFLSTIITARRKAVAIGYIFILSYPFFAAWFRVDMKKRILKTLLVAIFILGIGYLTVQSRDIGTLDEYLIRTESIPTKSLIRARTMFNSIISSWWGGGVKGIGIGALSQGAQHFLKAGQRSKIWAESGFGKVLGELGLIGSLAAVFLTVTLSNNLARAARLTMDDKRIHLVHVGLLAMFVSYLCAFFTASQIFGDPFVFTTISILIGFSLSTFKLSTGDRKDEPSTLNVEHRLRS